MSYAQFHDGFYRNAKVKRAGSMGAWMWAASIGYANENLTDGFIPLESLNELTELDSKPRLKLAAKLVEIGLWEVADGGWMIHDFLNWNFTREQILAKRAANLARVNKHRNNAPRHNDGNPRVMHYNDGDTSGDIGSEKSPSSGPPILGTSDEPPPTPPREPASGGLEPASALNADDIHALDLVAALASAPGALFSAAMGSDEDRLIVGRLMVVDGVDAAFARRMSELLRRPDEVWPWSKDFPKGGMKRVSVAWLRGAKTPNGQGSGCALSQLVDATRAMILAEERKASRRVDVRQPPTTPTDPKKIGGTPEFRANLDAKRDALAAAKADPAGPTTVPSSPILTIGPSAAESA